jgi:hypothetical protein
LTRRGIEVEYFCHCKRSLKLGGGETGYYTCIAGPPALAIVQ